MLGHHLNIRTCVDFSSSIDKILNCYNFCIQCILWCVGILHNFLTRIFENLRIPIIVTMLSVALGFSYLMINLID